ncbi:MAG: hypothetical protein ACOZQL_10525 [Myxococcota bacterium]
MPALLFLTACFFLLLVLDAPFLDRFWCRVLGHQVMRDERGAPVTSFYVCVRCGKFWR